MVALKWTYETAKPEFERRGFYLYEQEIRGLSTIVKFKCPSGHDWRTRLSDFIYGRGGCAVCNGNARYSYEDVKSYIENEGYVLLSREYRGANGLLNVVCPKGHPCKVRWSHFRTGARCKTCITESRKYTIGYIKTQLEKEEYTLHSKEYKGAHEKLILGCPNKHIFRTKWYLFQSGVRCAECAGNKKRDFEHARKVFAEYGYVLDEEQEYINSKTRLKYTCPNGHHDSMALNNFKNGYRCPQCFGNKPLEENYVKRKVEARGYSFISTYVKRETYRRYIKIICPEGHKIDMPWGSFSFNKSGCKFCANNVPLSPEKDALRRLKVNIKNKINACITRVADGKKPFKSTSAFALKVAKEVIKHLGFRPKGYELDHIIPTSYFDFKNKKEIEACWSIYNLRYLEKTKNMLRKNNLTVQETNFFPLSLMEILKTASLKPKKFNILLE